jgi:hypothetical protein
LLTSTQRRKLSNVHEDRTLKPLLKPESFAQWRAIMGLLTGIRDNARQDRWSVDKELSGHNRSSSLIAAFWCDAMLSQMKIVGWACGYPVDGLAPMLNDPRPDVWAQEMEAALGQMAYYAEDPDYAKPGTRLRAADKRLRWVVADAFKAWKPLEDPAPTLTTADVEPTLPLAPSHRVGAGITTDDL